ncbi:MAG TPA: fasciclin domain-containing protein, partial [Chitinophagaceae bacterium]|nr:fasciclin domain-containing protein [Chitinophagaceae bacterium]
MKTIFVWVSFFALCLAGCKKWDDHNKVENQDLSKTLLEEISGRSNLSKFYEYLKKTGLDKELSSSKTYTVWAPVNDALQSLDPAIVADSAKLIQFIANHISYQTYFTRNAQPAVRVPVLNGKRVTFSNTKFDEAN